MNFSIQKIESHTSIRVLNKFLDSLVAPGLKSELVLIVGNGEKNILIDLSSCDSCDSSGMSALLLGHRLCSGANGKFVLIGLSNALKESIEIVEFDVFLVSSESREEAEKLFA